MRDLTTKEEVLLARVEAKPELEPFFFKKLKGLHWLRPLAEKGYYNPENIPEPVTNQRDGSVRIPLWSPSIYLSSLSSELTDEDNKDCAELVLEIICKCTDYAKEKDISNYNVWYHFAQVLPYLPVSIINESAISAIQYWLIDPYERGMVAEIIGVDFLKRLIEEDDGHEYALILITSLFSISYEEKTTGTYTRNEIEFCLRDSSIQRIAKEIAPLVGSRLQINGIKLFEFLLTEILDKTEKDTWSSHWRKAIEDHKQNHSREDADDILITAYRDSLFGLIAENREEAEQYIIETLGRTYQTLNRIAIYAVGEHEYLLGSLASYIVNDRFFDNNYRHEMWHFMNKNFNKLSSDLQRLFIEHINNIVLKDDNNSIEERPTAYHKAVWLSAVKDCNENLLQQYDELIEVAGTEPDHPDFTSYMSTGGWVGDKTPIPLEELQQMTIPEVINVMDTTEEGNGFRESGRSGLIKVFKEVVKANPDETLDNLNLFLNKDLAYTHKVLEGFRELWNENAPLSWDDTWKKLLAFISLSISNDVFWSEENAAERDIFIANRHWVVSSISEFIKDGVRSDEHAFNVELLPEAYNIITTLLDQQEGEIFDIAHESVSTAINSPRGKCIETIINMTLRSMRTCEERNVTKEDVWKQYVNIYDNELKKADTGEFEFATLVTNYIPNFLYMSKDWTLDNLPVIFDRNNHQAWVSAFDGYSYVGTIYQEIYTFLRDNDHFSTALDDENLRSQVSDKIIQGAVVAFINNFEQLTDEKSLLSLLIDRSLYKELHQIIWFSWTQRKKEDDVLTLKILELWPYILKKIDFETSDGRKIASDLCDWVVFIEELTTDSFEWLNQIAPYAEDNHNSHDLLKGIHRLSLNQPHKSQKIWLRMLEQYSYDYPEEAIKGALSNILAIDTNSSSREGFRLAKEIVDSYLSHGFERPREWLNELRTSLSISDKGKV